MLEAEIRTVEFQVIAATRVALLSRTGVGGAAPTPGDEHPAARHVAASLGDRIVGTGSIHPQGMPGGPQTDAWKLTGIAVEHGHRGAGIGTLVVERCLEHAAEATAATVWCMAPAGTFGFFEKLGFDRSGDPIDDPDHGPHYLLYRKVRPLRRDWSLEAAGA